MEYGTPAWVEFLGYAGTVAGAVVSIALFFRGVRQWIAAKWRKLMRGSVTHRQLDARVSQFSNDLERKIEENREKFSHVVDEHYSLLIEQIQILTGKMTEVMAGVAELRQSSSRVSIVESMMRLSADRDDRVGTIYCDETGAVTFVSRTLAHWMEASRADLMKWRWLSFTPTKDRAAIRAELALARSEHREIRMAIAMGPLGEIAKPYLLTMTPMPDAPPAEAWAGYLTPVGHHPTDDQVV